MSGASRQHIKQNAMSGGELHFFIQDKSLEINKGGVGINTAK